MRALPTIVGAGPSGLLLGCLLRQQGVECQIVERQAEPSQLNRALMIHAASLDILDQVGLAQDVIALGLCQRYIRFHVEGRTCCDLDFGQLRGTGYPGYINLRQPVLEKLLTRRFIALGGSLLRGHRLKVIEQHNEDVRLQLDSPEGLKECRVPWLVGCDGANSTVRELLGIEFPGKDYPYCYVLAEGLSDDALAKDASHMFIGSNSALSVVPMDNGEIRIAGPGLAEDLSDRVLNSANVEAIFAQTGIEGLPRIKCYSAIRQYRVRERLAERFAAGRVFLCGDAAHLHSPAGGQAMNLGFGDVFALAWRLSSGADSVKVAEEYSSERRALAEAVIQRTQIAPLLVGMRQGMFDIEALRELTDSFSQLYHHLGDQHNPLRSRRLAEGIRLPNLQLADGGSLWRRIKPGWQKMDNTDVVGRALIDYFGQAANLKLRPDFVVERLVVGPSAQVMGAL